MVDIENIDSIKALLETHPPAGIFHLAGLMPPAAESDMFSVNVHGTYSLLSALYDGGHTDCRVVVTGSAAEYMPTQDGYYSELNPIGGATPYGRAKSAQSLLALSAAQRFGIELMIARPFNLIGPGLSTNLVAGNICAQLAAGQSKLKLGNTSTARDFIDIRDAVEAYIAVYEKGVAYESYNVCTGSLVSIAQLIDEAASVFGVDVEVETDSQFLKAQDFNAAYGNPEKITTATGWVPRFSLADSIKGMSGD